MALHRSTPVLPPSTAARVRLLHRSARPAPTRGAVVDSLIGRHAWSATGTITAFRAQRAIQPW